MIDNVNVRLALFRKASKLEIAVTKIAYRGVDAIDARNGL
jgi:hypothetical protein